MTSTVNKPFLKWPGGKSRISLAISECVPKGTTRLVEPFVGSASVAMNITAKNYLLADANADLIYIYESLLASPDRFIEDCRSLFSSKNNTKSGYISLRREFNASDDAYRRACIFVYLNRHCFNGLVRFNSSGVFNTPFGMYRVPYFPAKEMKAFAARLSNAVFTVNDFQEVMGLTGKGDFVYCDPPYVPNGKDGFTAYSRNGFGMKDQERLVGQCIMAAERGATVAVSNHDNPLTRRLYAGADRLITVMVKRTISCTSEARKPVGELIAVYGERNG